MKQIRKRLTYANVMSSLAMFMVLGGGAAIASNHILPKGSVGTPQLQKNAVKTGKVARNAIRVGKLAPEAVKAGKLAKNAVPTNRLRDNAVATSKIANDSVLTDKIANDAVTSGKIASGSVGTGEISAGASGVALAGVKSIGGNVTSWFNRFGGEPTIETIAPGVRNITFPGLPLNENQVIHQATLRGSARGLINAVAGADIVVVRTWNINDEGANTAGNRGFNYTVFGTQ